MQVVKKGSLFLFCVTMFSCDYILCGDLKGDWLALKQNAEREFGDQFDIENIPCEFYYINIKAKKSDIDTSALKTLHYTLFDSSKNIGWRTLVVFDRNGNYLFEDPLNGPRYKR